MKRVNLISPMYRKDSKYNSKIKSIIDKLQSFKNHSLFMKFIMSSS